MKYALESFIILWSLERRIDSLWDKNGNFVRIIRARARKKLGTRFRVIGSSRVGMEIVWCSSNAAESFSPVTRNLRPQEREYPSLFVKLKISYNRNEFLCKLQQTDPAAVSCELSTGLVKPFPNYRRMNFPQSNQTFWNVIFRFFEPFSTHFRKSIETILFHENKGFSMRN